MAIYECCRSVVFTEQAAVNIVKSIPGDKPVPTGGTCKTLGGGRGREMIKTRPEKYNIAFDSIM